MATHRIKDRSGDYHYLDDKEYKQYLNKGCMKGGCLLILLIIAQLILQAL